MWITALAILLAPAGTRADTESAVWSSYLDDAYIYASAEPELLRQQLKQFGAEAGISLERYISEHFAGLPPLRPEHDAAETRRKAIACLLDHLARGHKTSLAESVEAARMLETRLTSFENRYWYHYVLAHQALEAGDGFDFAEQVLATWLRVIVPLEVSFDALDTLALSEGPYSGFAAALPYLHENLARLILIRSQSAGLDRDLDSLGAIVQLLAMDRVGAYPDVIPREVSAQAYVEHVASQLQGASSDDGSLTFVLTLLRASHLHERWRAGVASGGLGDATLRAGRAAIGAYQTAHRHAETVQGECAAYTRALRLGSELYAAKQRLGSDAEIADPFTIESAMKVYDKLSAGLAGGWADLGYRNVERRDYVETMHALWLEIQEASLTRADYYLSGSAERPELAANYGRYAARTLSRYLAFFERYATPELRESVPESAYFAAFESSKGLAEAYLSYVPDASAAEVELAVEHYRGALELFPFDRLVWPALTSSLSRHGREGSYLALVSPVAERVLRSPSIDSWIKNGEPAAKRIEAVRLGLGDSLVILYMGFGTAGGVEERERELSELEADRVQLDERLQALARNRDELLSYRDAAVPASPARGDAAQEEHSNRPPELGRVARDMATAGARLERVDHQIAARSRALPLYRGTFASDDLARELRGRDDHPLHTLLRRMYYEDRL